MGKPTWRQRRGSICGPRTRGLAGGGGITMVHQKVATSLALEGGGLRRSRQRWELSFALPVVLNLGPALWRASSSASRGNPRKAPRQVWQLKPAPRSETCKWTMKNHIRAQLWLLGLVASFPPRSSSPPPHPPSPFSPSSRSASALPNASAALCNLDT